MSRKVQVTASVQSLVFHQALKISMVLFKIFIQSCTSPQPILTTQCQDFLKKLDLPFLDPEETDELGQPISLEELKLALKGMKKGKTSGLDGIPPEHLLQYFDILGPTMLQAVISAIKRHFSSTDKHHTNLSYTQKRQRSKILGYRPHWD